MLFYVESSIVICMLLYHRISAVLILQYVMFGALLCCAALHWIVLLCSNVLYCIVLYCIVLYCILLHCIVQYDNT